MSSLDAMSSITINTLALDDVGSIAFSAANAPASNPDGTFGVNFHYQIDETDASGTGVTFEADTLFPTCSDNFVGAGAPPTSFDALKAAHFGTPTEQGLPVTLQAKALAFH